jgi:uncharacterized protein (TIGR02646 family)
MMPIKRNYEHRNVKKLISANPYPTWDGNGTFDWKVIIDGRGFNVRKLLLPVLLEMTNKHCAFCDYYPLSSDFFHPPMEHFDPKSKSPQKAYDWENLFPVCNGCTEEKGEKFDTNLIKPDEEGYEFAKYFKLIGDGRIEPNFPNYTLEGKKASITIETYGLNKRTDLRLERKKWIKDYEKLKPKKIDEYPFRFIAHVLSKIENDDDVFNEFLS